MKKPAGLIDVPGKDDLRPHARNMDPYVAPNMKPLGFVQSHQMVHDYGAPTNAKYEPPFGSQSPASAQHTPGLPTSVAGKNVDKRLGTLPPLIPREPAPQVDPKLTV
jgi:hypothetical protein